MSEVIDNNFLQKQESLKHIIKQLHQGVPVEKLKKEFHKLIKNTSAEEIADMENSLINEGFPVEEVQRLCDVHASVFEDSLKKIGKAGKIPGHPVHSYIQENKELKKILKNVHLLLKRVNRKGPNEMLIRGFEQQFIRLKEIEKHFLRKENQLFPALEKQNFVGPTKVMWGKHDEIRQNIRQMDVYFIENEWVKLFKEFKTASSALKKLIFLEEKILYPTSLRKLSKTEWAQIKRGETEIGYAWITPSNLWDANLAAGQTAVQQIEALEIDQAEISGLGKIKLDSGELTRDQINLMLKNLPFDVTFVDENNKVCYYSDTAERIFPRSPGIIGREVQNCHPPKSVHVVNNIIKSFKEKTKNVAEFWIKSGKLFIHIRYFPVYDENGDYRGTIEVSQEISDIQKLTGERRLLDW
ncbi:MAG: DUF438 domain-containing protein [Candidatus Marinimicrobia bacterium]|nr:DUF438 domain-containing protein [Candidatus Neomarinimicrobiota bacterium]